MVFAASANFYDQVLFFAYFFLIMNISLTLLVVFKSRGLRKELTLTFLIRPYQQTVIVNHVFMCKLWRHRKSHVAWVTTLMFLKDLAYYLIHANFHSQVLTSSRLMTLGWGGAFRLPSSRPGYLMSKKFKLIRFKLQSWLNTCFCFTDGSECYNAINFKK